MCPEHLGLACNTEKLNNIHNKTEMLECLWMTTDMKPKNCERKKLMKTLCCI